MSKYFANYTYLIIVILSDRFFSFQLHTALKICNFEQNIQHNRDLQNF